nr:753_t:CDS:1 [Entrophospora candida]
MQDLSSSPTTSLSSSRSTSPEPTLDPIIINYSLHRHPTFSYTPIHTRRRSNVCNNSKSPISIRSLSFSPISLPTASSAPDLLFSSSSSSFKTNSSSGQTPESEIPSTPTSSIFSTSDSLEYTSFPNFEKFADESWSDNKKAHFYDLEMESYDEMFVNGIRLQY